MKVNVLKMVRFSELHHILFGRRQAVVDRVDTCWHHLAQLVELSSREIVQCRSMPLEDDDNPTRQAGVGDMLDIPVAAFIDAGGA